LKNYFYQPVNDQNISVWGIVKPQRLSGGLCNILLGHSADDPANAGSPCGREVFRATTEFAIFEVLTKRRAKLQNITLANVGSLEIRRDPTRKKIRINAK
jgi:hypothetical protein